MPPKKKTTIPSAKRRLNFGPTSNEPPPSTSKKRTRSSLPETTSTSSSLLSSPVKRARPSKAIVTPDATHKSRAKKEYVPTYLHKNVAYQRKGSKNLPPTKLTAFQQVKKHYSIPKDLEQSRKYGSLSGSSYEERVLQAYSLNQLKPLPGAQEVLICTVCAAEGHDRDACPTLI